MRFACPSRTSAFEGGLVEGADHYRNPDQDLPGDFERQRPVYYAVLRLPSSANSFLAGLQREMHEAFAAFHDGVGPTRVCSSLIRRRLDLTVAFAHAAGPANLAALKARMLERWPMTSLLNLFKEADLRIGFTDVSRSATAWEEPLPELLLTLCGLG